MGLIDKMNSINYSLNKYSRQRQEREIQKELKENYTSEIKTHLYNAIYDYYIKYDIETAYKKVLINKDNIIQELTEIINNIHIMTKETKYDRTIKNWNEIQVKKYLYKDFNVFQDLENNFFTQLNKCKKTFEELTKINEKDLLKKLENEITGYFRKYQYNIIAIERTLNSYDVMEIIANDISKNDVEYNFIIDNYVKTFNKVKRMFGGAIQEQKQQYNLEKQRIRQQAKIKRQNSLINAYMINRSLRGLNKLLK